MLNMYDGALQRSPRSVVEITSSTPSVQLISVHRISSSRCTVPYFAAVHLSEARGLYTML
jgi:hypothetical protein